MRLKTRLTLCWLSLGSIMAVFFVLHHRAMTRHVHFRWIDFLAALPRRDNLLLIGGALVVLLMLALVLARWVERPVRLLSTSLSSGNATSLGALLRRHDEFGELARLIASFFRQQGALREEIRQRQEAEASRRTLEEQFRQAQKMESIGRLTGGIAHDANNIITAIMGYCEVLEGRLQPDDPAQKYVAEIRKAADRFARLTHQLLAFSRRQALQARPIDLNALLDQLKPLIEQLVGKQVRLELDRVAALPPLLIDPHQLEQVIMNLAVNARDAMPDGGRFTIRTGQQNTDGKRRIILTVSDTGCGMDETTLNHLFEPFFTTKEPGKGTGLGLSVVYGIVKQSGGEITVTSRPGQGTAFEISFPLVSAAAPR